MGVFTVPDLATGPPGPPGIPGPPGSAILGGYAMIFSADVAIAQAFTMAAGFEKITAFATNGLSAGNAVPAAASDEITVNEAGTWAIFYSVSAQQTLGPAVFQILAPHVNGVALTSIQTGWLGRASPFSNTTACCSLATLATGDVIDLRADTSLADVTLTFSQLQLGVARWAP